jgi:hypothetical protein
VVHALTLPSPAACCSAGNQQQRAKDWLCSPSPAYPSSSTTTTCRGCLVHTAACRGTPLLRAHTGSAYI